MGQKPSGERPELQVWIPEANYRQDGTTYVAVAGACDTLGDWDPDELVKLQQLQDGRWILEDLPEDVPPGTEYKYVIVNNEGHGGGTYFEERRPRHWPRVIDYSAFPPEHRFNQDEPDLGWETRYDPRWLAEAGKETKLLWGTEKTRHNEDAWPPKGHANAIFHAFHWQFKKVAAAAVDIASAGFDAVQISPAQQSRESRFDETEADDAWFWRYQPVNYEVIKGLGSKEDLRAACAACNSNGMQVIADVVFNHMVCITSSSEWESAQADPRKLEALKKKLEETVGPRLDRGDFQWPWIKLEGDMWDTEPFRFDGWGNGEWSTLNLYSPKVVDLHEKHLKLLMECGCAGFRIDAAKHMRPEVVANYKRLAEGIGKSRGGKVPFVYAEVLTNEEEIHKEYLDAIPPATKYPTPPKGGAAQLFIEERSQKTKHAEAEVARLKALLSKTEADIEAKREAKIEAANAQRNAQRKAAEEARAKAFVEATTKAADDTKALVEESKAAASEDMEVEASGEANGGYASADAKAKASDIKAAKAKHADAPFHSARHQPALDVGKLTRSRSMDDLNNKVKVTKLDIKVAEAEVEKSMSGLNFVLAEERCMRKDPTSAATSPASHSAPPLPNCVLSNSNKASEMVTTDFQLAIWLRRLVDGGEFGWPALKCKRSQTCYEVPMLARNSVRFLRNHDTIGNEEDICGLGGISLACAAVPQALLLAAHDGVPLVLAEDVLGSQLIRQAARYRRDLRKRFATLPDRALGVWTDVRVRGARRARPPGLICVAVRLQDEDKPDLPTKKLTSQATQLTDSAMSADAIASEEGPDSSQSGSAIGFSVLNPTIDEPAGPYGEGKVGIALNFRGSDCLADSVGITYVPVPEEEAAPDGLGLNVGELEEEKKGSRIKGKPLSAAQIAVLIRRPGKDPYGCKQKEALLPECEEGLPEKVLILPGGVCMPPFRVEPASGVFFIRHGDARKMSIKTEKVDWNIEDGGFNAPRDSAQSNVPESESQIYCQPESTAKLTFTLRSETQVGQKIILCGSLPELGSWNPEKGIILTKVNDAPAMWRAKILVDLESFDEPVIYKYVGDYRQLGGAFDWEHTDRRVQIPGTTAARLQKSVGHFEWDTDIPGFNSSRWC